MIAAGPCCLGPLLGVSLACKSTGNFELRDVFQWLQASMTRIPCLRRLLIQAAKRLVRADLLGALVCVTADWRGRMPGAGPRGEAKPRLGDAARPFCGCKTATPLAAQENRAPLSFRSSVPDKPTVFQYA